MTAVTATLHKVRAIRKKMMEIMTREASSVDLKGLVGKLIPEAIGGEIKKACSGAGGGDGVWRWWWGDVGCRVLGW